MELGFVDLMTYLEWKDVALQKQKKEKSEVDEKHTGRN